MTLSTAKADMPATLGRFQLVGRLGQGSQSEVYLAFDPQLQREVALKAMRASASDAATAALLNEARAVSRLVHPAIVPVYEAGEEAGTPYLVFEYVAGWTLSELLARLNGLDATQAVVLLLPVLDAVDYAHAHKVIHRDLKPSNILLDPSGLARVMDFGIAVRHRDADPADEDGMGQLLGTPAYMAPEYVREGRVTAQMDVYSAGLILFEILCGRRAVHHDNGIKALQEVAHQRLCLPKDTPTYVDDALREIINRALARDTGQRYASMQALLQDLRQWLSARQSAQRGVEVLETAVHSRQEVLQREALERVLQRVGAAPDMAALAGSVALVQRPQVEAWDDMQAVSQALQGDLTLSLRVLRLANSALHKGGAQAEVFTVSRALMLLGLNTVRTLVGATPQLEQHRDPARVQALQDESLRAHFSAELAQALSGLQGHAAEEARMCGLFHGLGRWVVLHHFPEEAQDIRQQLQTRPGQTMAVVRQVLGLDYAALGQGLARHWGLPGLLAQAMRCWGPHDALPNPQSLGERLALLAALASELGELIGQSGSAAPAPVPTEAMTALVQRYGGGLGLGPDAAWPAVHQAQTRTLAWARSVGLDLAGSPWRCALNAAT